ncbi:MAG: hypothetical protein RMJ44_03240 [Cytophagales bacterium]|nr:hypothetical protein [Bernardetiaceae bacterium]MDW8210078.1 hypothetical protein [Cytophagales bacterium]
MSISTLSYEQLHLQMVFNQPGYQIAYDAEKQLLIVTDSLQTADPSCIMETIEALEKAILEYKPVYFLADSSARSSVFPIELHWWIAEKLLKACLTVNMKKAAFVQPSDPIASISSHQVADQVSMEEIPIEAGFFSNYEEAFEWLFRP